MPIEGENIPIWLTRIKQYLGEEEEKKPRGRPRKMINEDLLIELHNDMGWSNRRIARELGFANRTIDRRIIKLRKEGRLE